MSEMAPPTSKELVSRVYKMIPPMLGTFHKGQLGRVAVIGGSEDYTGAPYFSAMASARLGCDMSHVICEIGAGQVIKTYSPNLMVHPYLRSTKSASSSDTASSLAQSVIAMLSRLHVLVIGPGLGRDKLMQDTVAEVLKEARKQNIPVVLDADGLILAQERPELVKGFELCILTPNVVEFGRLAKSVNLDMNEGEPATRCARLAKAFGGVTIIQKGQSDNISNGDHTAISDGEGGLKRSGGQGDTLTGTLGTLLAYRKAYHDRIWQHENDLPEKETLALAAWAGSAITRECSRLAFKEKGRSLQAGDLTDKVTEAFQNIIGEKGSRL
ncbi:carbohydrate kinase [Eremomyces bilateralis CBS 781.70]|uniref:ATP-dependent (S)-NAD(P)H-hydrate dehydratase n=1 Tax=Eremomyces bilateralis CBS 781.70 TaxID=1392243 RepID=A0A6G1FQI1_9PEZI|nr:carbohydrate kinase [Eremomyces bilateralis CBS 781.70]KAF1808054.1 carbohydrate kinase [Eremomyces bilateralis CBS 781.70]